MSGTSGTAVCQEYMKCQDTDVIHSRNNKLELMIMKVSEKVGMSDMLGILGMLRVIRMPGQTSSVIPFGNHNLELI